jgi:hypothetical protein
MTAKRFRLLSTRLVCTPGLLTWAIAGFKGGDRKDRRLMVNLLAGTYPGVTADIAHGLLTGRIPYAVVGDVVEFEVPAPAPVGK